MLGGKELGAVQGLLQAGDLGTGTAACQLSQYLGVALAGDEVLHDVPPGHAVQVRSGSSATSSNAPSSFPLQADARKAGTAWGPKG
ncbi:MAG TPA: hypothetical protein VMV07_19440 [Streptosporangiaceae bacterium]|nr:hypothetical protein [Streptosporangiaceae bacterium]